MAAMDEQVARFREDYYLLTGAALRKSAYLALFRLVGYRYGLDAVGSTVQLALAEFFRQHASWANAKDHFGRFHGAVIVSLGGILDTIPDTLEGGMMLMHYAEGTASTGILFAVSCLFRVNACTLIVTLPAYSKYVYGLDASVYYRRLLADRAMKHSIHLTQFHGDWFEMGRTPLETQYVSSTTLAT